MKKYTSHSLYSQNSVLSSLKTTPIKRRILQPRRQKSKHTHARKAIIFDNHPERSPSKEVESGNLKGFFPKPPASKHRGSKMYSSGKKSPQKRLNLDIKNKYRSVAHIRPESQLSKLQPCSKKVDYRSLLTREMTPNRIVQNLLRPKGEDMSFLGRKQSQAKNKKNQKPIGRSKKSLSYLSTNSFTRHQNTKNVQKKARIVEEDNYGLNARNALGKIINNRVNNIEVGQKHLDNSSKKLFSRIKKQKVSKKGSSFHKQLKRSFYSKSGSKHGSFLSRNNSKMKYLTEGTIIQDLNSKSNYTSLPTHNRQLSSHSQTLRKKAQVPKQKTIKQTARFKQNNKKNYENTKLSKPGVKLEHKFENLDTGEGETYRDEEDYQKLASTERINNSKPSKGYDPRQNFKKELLKLKSKMTRQQQSESPRFALNVIKGLSKQKKSKCHIHIDLGQESSDGTENGKSTDSFTLDLENSEDNINNGDSRRSLGQGGICSSSLQKKTNGKTKNFISSKHSNSNHISRILYRPPRDLKLQNKLNKTQEENRASLTIKNKVHRLNFREKYKHQKVYKPARKSYGYDTRDKPTSTHYSAKTPVNATKRSHITTKYSQKSQKKRKSKGRVMSSQCYRLPKPRASIESDSNFTSNRGSVNSNVQSFSDLRAAFSLKRNVSQSSLASQKSQLTYQQADNFSKKYRFISGPSLGSGFSATVRPAYNVKTKEIVAVKTYAKVKIKASKVLERSFNNELRILRVMAGKRDTLESRGCVFPGIGLISMHKNIRDINLVVDYAGETSLKKFIKSTKMDRLGHQKVRAILRDLATIIKLFHEENICHGDIKLENVVLDKESIRARLVDYGFARFNAHQKSKMVCGTPNYMAPELLKMKGGDKNKGFYPKPVDIWALGVLMYYCLTKNFPFEAHNEPELLLKIAEEDVNYSSIKDTKAVDLIQQCLNRNPIRRIKI